jgi:hypothetical protein
MTARHCSQIEAQENILGRHYSRFRPNRYAERQHYQSLAVPADMKNRQTRPRIGELRLARPPAEFYEFFAGGGMVRAGLGPSWSCQFANDFDPKKAASYAANWGAGQLRIEDVANLIADDLTGSTDLAWGPWPPNVDHRA